MNKCPICGCNCEGEYCFHHKPRKPLNRTPIKNNKKTDDEIEEEIIEKEQMWQLFLWIWEERPHISEVSGTPIYGEPLTTYFHHILPKSKYPQFKLLPENIIILTTDEHQKVEVDNERYEEINKRREEILSRP